MAGRLSYCGSQVRRHDPDRFLTCLFAPSQHREALFALYAFNYEIAKTRETVTEPIMGQIRLQWWREAIAELYAGQIRGHEVLQALATVLPGRVQETALQALIDAREMDLEMDPPATGAQLVHYTRTTGGGLMQVAAMLLGVEDDLLLEAAEDIGEAVALTGLLRAVPFCAAQRKTYLPADLLRQMGINPADAWRARPAGLEVVTGLMATEAKRLLEAHRMKLDRNTIAAFLPGTVAGYYLQRLGRLGHDVYDPRLQAPGGSKPLLLARAWAAQQI